MAASTGLLALLVVLLPMASHSGTSGEFSLPAVSEPLPRAAGDSHDCMTLLMEKLSPCALYVVAGSNLAAPGSECCMGLAAVASGAPQCLCGLVDAVDGEYGVKIDHDRASKVPGVCKVEIPPLMSPCLAGAAPSPSPTASLSCHPKCNGVDPGLGSPSQLALLAGLAFAAVRFF